MKKHTKTYFEFFEVEHDASTGWHEFWPCEIPDCGKDVQDVHHIECKGMGGNPSQNLEKIENYMGLCRHHHNMYGDKKQYMTFLKNAHKRRMNMKKFKL